MIANNKDNIKRYTVELTKDQADLVRKVLKAVYMFKLGDSSLVVQGLEVGDTSAANISRTPVPLTEESKQRITNQLNSLLAKHLGLKDGELLSENLFEDVVIMKRLSEVDNGGGEVEKWDLTYMEIAVLNQAVEAYARFVIGQPDVLVDMLQKKDKKWAGGWDFSDEVGKIVKPAINLTSGGSYGIGKFDNADELYMIHTAIRHHLAWERARREGKTNPDGSRNWSNMLGVSYDEPMKLGSGIVPKVATVK